MTAPTRPRRGELTASAARYTARRLRTKPVDGSWQERAWLFYDETPEVRFAARWYSNAMSRARLIAGRRDDEGNVVPLPNGHRARELVAEIAGGLNGQAQLLGSFGPHLTVAGEAWIVVRPREDSQGNAVAADWRVLSTQEVKPQGTKLVAEIDGEDVAIPGAEDETTPRDSDEPVAIRVWEAHPRRHLEADSAVRSSLGLLEELKLLNAAVAAIARSRLTGRGIVLVPQGTKFPTTPNQGDEEDDLIEVLMTVAETAYKEPDSAAATVPIILEVPADQIPNIKRLTFESDFDTLAIQLREEAITRFANGLEVPAEILLGQGDINHWCTLPTVQIMTHNGWKTYEQLTPGELVLTLNHDTGLSEWQPLQAVNTWQVVDEPLVRIKGKRHSSLTTGAHRWPILTGRPEHRGRAWTTSKDLLHDRTRPDAQGHFLEHLVLAAPHADLPTEPKYADALVELVAWYFTEGSTGVRPGRNAPKVLIHQSHMVNPDNCARIERALTSLFGPASASLDKGGRYATAASVERRAAARSMRQRDPKLSYAEIGRQLGVSAQMVSRYLKEDDKTADGTPRWRVTYSSDFQVAHYRLNAAAGAVILEHAPERVVSLEFIRQLTQSQLELFIDTAVRGDGWLINSKTPVLTQKDPAMLDAFELAIILSGRSPLSREHTSEGRSANGPRVKTQNLVTASDTTTFAVQAKHLSEETYTGTIWCPTTPNGTWLARHEGSVFFTGNSAWALKDEAITLGVEPKLGTVADALTSQYLQPLLEAENVPDALDCMVWYDTSPLRVRTNRAETALKVHERGAISDSALRRETGFNDSDAPTEEERARHNEQPQGGQDGKLPVDESNAEPERPTEPPAETEEVPASATPTAEPAAVEADFQALRYQTVLAAIDGVIHNAMCMVGEKIRVKPACPRSERGRSREIPPGELHTHFPVADEQIDQWHLLVGAWDRVPEMAARYGFEAECLIDTLDNYARALIAARMKHSFAETVRLLRNSCLGLAA
ncbi:hypothetical protein ABTY98_41570 [Streptomyces sp. NPDC096040]|uniref:hypothetical protein n=1 Tax=Streptomyces sp. NPDC096040 TaxID=3155541 RepID=UPI003317BF0A